MKNKIIIGCILLFQSFTMIGQEHIQFQKIDFAQAKEKAAQENKLIFLDGYTSWCAPCKWMEGNVFNKTEIAQYFNSKFVNIKVDCEVGEGIDIAKTYQIKSFPTYLFLDGKGTLIYRTQSKMEADLFLKEAEKANDPAYNIPLIRAQYINGNRDAKFLVRYLLVMNNVDQKLADQAKKSLDSVATNTFLHSPEGWETIKIMAKFNTDKYGAFFQDNKAYFKSIARPEEFLEKEAQLIRTAMYGYIRDKNKEKYDEGLNYFSQFDDHKVKVDIAMYQAEWAGTNGTSKDFISVTNKLRKGVLKNEDEKLSFIARRYGNAKMNEFDQKNLKQCYILAKQAVKLNPESYSNQGTFAEICISLKKKSEAVKAALAARAIAEDETSKIQKIADALVERAKAL
ncbi:MAG: DUF255 domain-containing protein [Bacteroidia bacterium]|nr:MAG: DUF255 domain-containing protein [Bacteroidia bacterium]